MSIWSSIGKVVSGAVKAVGSLDPTGIFGNVAESLMSPLDSAVENQQNKENWRRQTSWQEKMISQNQEFNSLEAEKSRQFNSLEAEKSRQFNSLEAEKAHQRNIDLFNMENEYNSPAAQVARMRKAGLNPASFGGGSLVPASASASPSASGSAASGSPASSSVPSVPSLQNPLSIAQYRLLNEQSRSLNLANREKSNELRTKERLLDSPFDVFRTETNGDGTKDYIVVRHPQGNYWDELRDRERVVSIAHSLSNDERQLSYDILKSTKNFVVQGKEKELQKLIKEVALLKNEEEVSSFKNNILRKYGINPDADWINNIMTMVLSNPGNAANVLNSVYSTLYNFILNNARNVKNVPSIFSKYLNDIYDIYNE